MRQQAARGKVGTIRRLRIVVSTRDSSDIAQPKTDKHVVEPISRRMRGRFALVFGDQRQEGSTVIDRQEKVRETFSSPFWPFVLATTSVGQEGLDFHPYCHAVVHWNLPSNPVDLEQREGRVHRYKGHAVRKKLARQYGLLYSPGDRRDP